MGLLDRVLGYHRVDDWLGAQTLTAARTLNTVVAEVMVSVEPHIAQSGLKDGLIAPAAFINEHVTPILRDISEPIARSILEAANEDLAVLVDARVIWSKSVDHSAGSDAGFSGSGDVAAVAVPLAVGIATATALPIAAVTTTTSFLGLVTTTAISWPVVVGGGALAGLGLATGLLNAAKLRERTAARLRDKTREFVISALITGSEAGPSLLQQLSADFNRTAQEAKRLW